MNMNNQKLYKIIGIIVILVIFITQYQDLFRKLFNSMFGKIFMLILLLLLTNYSIIIGLIVLVVIILLSINLSKNSEGFEKMCSDPKNPECSKQDPKPELSGNNSVGISKPALVDASSNLIDPVPHVPKAPLIPIKSDTTGEPVVNMVDKQLNAKALITPINSKTIPPAMASLNKGVDVAPFSANNTYSLTPHQ